MIRSDTFQNTALMDEYVGAGKAADTATHYITVQESYEKAQNTKGTWLEGTGCQFWETCKFPKAHLRQ